MSLNAPLADTVLKNFVLWEIVGKIYIVLCAELKNRSGFFQPSVRRATVAEAAIPSALPAPRVTAAVATDT